MHKRSVVARFCRRAAHLQHPAGSAARKIGRNFGQDRYRGAPQNMCGSDTRGGRRSQNAWKIRAVAGRFRARFDDIEDRSGTARFAGANDVEIDAYDRVVLEKQRTQLSGIDD